MTCILYYSYSLKYSVKLRTCVNVWGDCIGAGVVNALSKDDFKHLGQDHGLEDRDNEDESIDMKSKRDVEDEQEIDHLL